MPKRLNQLITPSKNFLPNSLCLSPSLPLTLSLPPSPPGIASLSWNLWFSCTNSRKNNYESEGQMLQMPFGQFVFFPPGLGILVSLWEKFLWVQAIEVVKRWSKGGISGVLRNHDPNSTPGLLWVSAAYLLCHWIARKSWGSLWDTHWDVDSTQPRWLHI